MRIDVASDLIDGRMVVRDLGATTFDPEEVRRRAAEALPHLVARAGI